MEKEKVKYDYTIRPLKQKDREVLSNLLVKLADKLEDTSIFDVIKSKRAKTKANDKTKEPTKEEEENSIIRLGIDLIGVMTTTLNTDVKEWFADLLGVKIEDYSELPFDIETQVLGQIQEQEVVANFFYGLFQRFKEIRKFQK